jgi:hypothetical protein
VVEINPGHPVTDGLREHWFKLLAVVLYKYRRELPSTVSVSEHDLREFESAWEGMGVLVAEEKGDRILLRIVDEKEAHAIARKEGERG